jgi:hypothetical protein
MAEFILLFRKDITAPDPSPEEWQELGKLWWQWRTQLEKQNKMASSANRLSKGGRVVKQKGIVINGPYAEIKEGLAGYMVVHAADFEEAVSLAKECPILRQGGNVEVRQFISPDDNET